MARNFVRSAATAGQYIDCGTSSLLNPANNLSLACWVRFSTFNFGSYAAQFLITRDNSTSARCYGLALFDFQGTPNTFAFTVFKNSDVFTTIQDTTAVTANTWFHVAATYEFVTDGTSVMKLYKNGTQVASATNAVGPIFSGTTNTQIGQRIGYAPFPLAGQLAECAIYNITLSATDVLALSVGAVPRMVRPNGLVFYAPLVREIIDIKGISLTNNNTTLADHPRIYS